MQLLGNDSYPTNILLDETTDVCTKVSLTKKDAVGIDVSTLL